MIGRGEVDGIAEESCATGESVVTFPEVHIERSDCHVDAAEVLEVELVEIADVLTARFLLGSDAGVVDEALKLVLAGLVLLPNNHSGLELNKLSGRTAALDTNDDIFADGINVDTLSLLLVTFSDAGETAVVDAVVVIVTVVPFVEDVCGVCGMAVDEEAFTLELGKNLSSWVSLTLAVLDALMAEVVELAETVKDGLIALVDSVEAVVSDALLVTALVEIVDGDVT